MGLWSGAPILIYINTYQPTCTHQYIHTLVCIYIHIYTHTYTHIHMHTYTRSYLHRNTHTKLWLHTYVPTNIHTHIKIYIHMYLHIHIRTYKHTYTHENIHTYMHTYINTHVRTFMNTYMYTYKWTCIHISRHALEYIERRLSIRVRHVRRKHSCEWPCIHDTCQTLRTKVKVERSKWKGQSAQVKVQRLIQKVTQADSKGWFLRGIRQIQKVDSHYLTLHI